jgi:UDP-N-acetylglucosamine:LPS N-acetylglucosamine transferase
MALNSAMAIVPYIKKPAIDIIYDQCKQQKIDFIISVVPCVNDIIAQSAKKLNIPFLIVPTDLDSTIFLKNVDLSQAGKTLVAIAYNNKKVSEIPRSLGISEKNIRFTGFPLRKSFYEFKNKIQIKKDFSLDTIKSPKGLLLMGTVGLNTISDYVKKLSEIKVPLHLLVCVGKNKELKNILETIKKPQHFTIQPIDFTNRIADLMAVSDFGISKPGSVSFNEALQMKLPVIWDGTGNSFKWESFNLDLVQENRFGNVCRSYDELVPLATQFCKSKYRKSLRKNMKKFNKEYSNTSSIPSVVNELMNEKQD